MYDERLSSYFECGRKDIPELLKMAERTKATLLKELSAFYNGDIDIEIFPKEHPFCWSIAGNLTVCGKKVREYDPVDLCFLELNELMLKRLLEGCEFNKEEKNAHF